MSTADGSSGLDLYRVRQAFGDDEEAVQEVIDEWLGFCTEALARLRQGITAGDYREIFESAHGIKGSSATVGATEAAALAKDVEMLGRSSGDMNQIRALTEKLASRLEALRKSVKGG